MTTFSCLRRPSWILAAILGKKMLQKYSHNSSIILINFELSNFKTKKKVLTPTSYIKLLEYILITIFKENKVCCLCDTIPLHCFRGQIYFKYLAWVGCISVANHNWSCKTSWNENCQIDKQRNC